MTIDKKLEIDIKDEIEWCPVKATMCVLERKWALQIIKELVGGTRRFNQLQAVLEGINAKTLSQRLKELEGEELVQRVVLSHIPPWVEYSLTQKGQEMSEIIDQIDVWARKWMQSPLLEEQREKVADLR